MGRLRFLVAGVSTLAMLMTGCAPRTPHPGPAGPGDPIDPVGPIDDQALAAGQTYTCALAEGGTVKCWGNNIYGQLGDGNATTRQLTPVTVEGLTGATQVAAGNYHTCALVADGNVYCWGHNGIGQLGDGTTTRRTTPVTVVGL